MTVVAAIVVAAGSGTRLGAATPKALVHVAGRPLVQTAVRTLAAVGVDPVVVVAPPGIDAEIRAALPPTAATARVVPGGATRAASVRAGIGELAAGEVTPDLVAVHDAARAFVPADVVQAAVAAVHGDVIAAAPAVPVADTLKQVDDHRVVATVDRGGLVAVQTPQVVRWDVLVAAHRSARDATDDLALVEAAVAAGEVVGRIVVVDGSPLATKITYAHDIALLEAMVEHAP